MIPKNNSRLISTTNSRPITTVPNWSTKYVEIKTIGQGAFGRVFIAKSDEGIFAIKIMNISKESTCSMFRNEVKCLNQLKMQRMRILENLKIQFDQKNEDKKKKLDHLLEMKEYFEDKQAQEGIIVMKYYENSVSLDKYFEENPLTEELVLKIFFQIAQGLSFMHSLKMYHRDLKLANFLYVPEIGHLVIIDFGIAQMEMSKSYQDDQAGTLAFLSPNSLLYRASQADKNDLWALGVVLYYMLHKQYPICNANEPIEFRQGAQKLINRESKIFFKEDLSPTTLVLLKNLLEIDEDQRKSVDNILITWFQQNENCQNQNEQFPQEFFQQITIPNQINFQEQQYNLRCTAKTAFPCQKDLKEVQSKLKQQALTINNFISPNLNEISQQKAQPQLKINSVPQIQQQFQVQVQQQNNTPSAQHQKNLLSIQQQNEIQSSYQAQFNQSKSQQQFQQKQFSQEFQQQNNFKAQSISTQQLPSQNNLQQSSRIRTQINVTQQIPSQNNLNQLQKTQQADELSYSQQQPQISQNQFRTQQFQLQPPAQAENQQKINQQDLMTQQYGDIPNQQSQQQQSFKTQAYQYSQNTLPQQQQQQQQQYSTQNYNQIFQLPQQQQYSQQQYNNIPSSVNQNSYGQINQNMNSSMIRSVIQTNDYQQQNQTQNKENCNNFINNNNMNDIESPMQDYQGKKNKSFAMSLSQIESKILDKTNMISAVSKLTCSEANNWITTSFQIVDSKTFNSRVFESITNFQQHIKKIENIASQVGQKNNLMPIQEKKIQKKLSFFKFYIAKLTQFLVQSAISYKLLDEETILDDSSNFLLSAMRNADPFTHQITFEQLMKISKEFKSKISDLTIQMCQLIVQSANSTENVSYFSSLSQQNSNKFLSQIKTPNSQSSEKRISFSKSAIILNSNSSNKVDEIEQASQLYQQSTKKPNKLFSLFVKHSHASFPMGNRKEFNSFLITLYNVAKYLENSSLNQELIPHQLVLNQILQNVYFNTRQLFFEPIENSSTIVLRTLFDPQTVMKQNDESQLQNVALILHQA